MVLLVAIAFALITVDIRGGDASPLGSARSVAADVFGPVENGVASAVNPVGNAIQAVRDSATRHNELAYYQRQNELLRQQLGDSDANRNRAREMDKLLRVAGAGQYGIKAAQVVAIGAAQNFSWTVTIDSGSDDGIRRDMTVLNGDGLVGRVTTVSDTTSTVLLACDPDFTVGTRLEDSMELGFGTGQGDRPMKVQLLNGNAKVHLGERLVTFGSQNDQPFVPGVPIGTIVGIDPAAGGLTRTVEVKPFVGFTRLDVVGVVVVPPRRDPRDTVLPPRQQPKPTPTVTVTEYPSAPPSGAPDKDSPDSPALSPAPSTSESATAGGER